VRYDPISKPGIANLIEILHVATGDPMPAIEERYGAAGYGAFKQGVGDAVIALFEPIRRRFDELRADEGELRSLLAAGAEKARSVSAPMLEATYERMGFLRP